MFDLLKISVLPSFVFASLWALFAVGGKPSSALAFENQTGYIIDWSGLHSQQQETDSSCGSFQFKGSQDGKIYSLLVKGRNPGLCSFHEPGVTFHMPNDFQATAAGKQALFSFTRTNNDIYVAWIMPWD